MIIERREFVGSCSESVSTIRFRSQGKPTILLSDMKRPARRCSCGAWQSKGASSYAAQSTYSEIIPIVPSHVSTNSGHPVIGNFVRRSPNACPPCAYRCISTGTPAFFSAM